MKNQQWEYKSFESNYEINHKHKRIQSVKEVSEFKPNHAIPKNRRLTKQKCWTPNNNTTTAYKLRREQHKRKQKYYTNPNLMKKMRRKRNHGNQKGVVVEKNVLKIIKINGMKKN